MESVDLVSIIIPVYNVSPYLAESLDSVIHQTYKKLEIIVIDDGSTDGSGEICDEYAGKDNRVRVIHQDNLGLSAARNTGLDIMTGEIVAFLDSDDSYHPDFVSNMLEVMTRESADIVVCKFTIHHTTGSMRTDGHEIADRSVKTGIYDRASALRILADSQINPGVWNKLYRASLWKDIRFPVGHVYENIDTIFRIFDLCSKIVVLDESLYSYRKRHGSITEVVSWKNIDDWLLARSHFEAFIIHNIPGIFTEDDLNGFNRITMNHSLSCYFDLIRSKETGRENTIKKLRKQLVENGQLAGMEKSKRYWMLCHCPWLLKVAYPVYDYLRRLRQTRGKLRNNAFQKTDR